MLISGISQEKGKRDSQKRSYPGDRKIKEK